jgi:hypothetical protein
MFIHVATFSKISKVTFHKGFFFFYFSFFEHPFKFFSYIEKLGGGGKRLAMDFFLKKFFSLYIF